MQLVANFLDFWKVFVIFVFFTVGLLKIVQQSLETAQYCLSKEPIFWQFLYAQTILPYELESPCIFHFARDFKRNKNRTKWELPVHVKKFDFKSVVIYYISRYLFYLFHSRKKWFSIFPLNISIQKITALIVELIGVAKIGINDAS